MQTPKRESESWNPGLNCIVRKNSVLMGFNPLGDMPADRQEALLYQTMIEFVDIQDEFAAIIEAGKSGNVQALTNTPCGQRRHSCRAHAKRVSR